jgi:hypothetical protein
MFIIFPHTKFRVPNFNSSLAIRIKLKAIYIFPTATMLIYAQKITLIKVDSFRRFIAIHNFGNVNYVGWCRSHMTC